MTLDRVVDSHSAMKLVRLGHLFGNQHYLIKIKGNKIYVCSIGDRNVLNRKIEESSLSGLTITWEQTTTMQDAIVHHQY